MILYDCVLVILLVNEVRGIPMSQCLPTKDVRLESQSHLELHCGSICATGISEYYEWIQTQRTGNDVILPEIHGSQIVIKSVEYKDGGTYKCRCLPDGPLCQQNVYIIPSMEFVASDKYIHNTDSVDFECTTQMTNPNASVITTKSGTAIRQHIKMVGVHTSVTVSAGISQGILKEDYVCVAESYIKGILMDRLEKTLTVYQYVPPEILFTADYNIGRGDLGKTARLRCTVTNSPQTKSVVTWMFHDKSVVPLEDGKYSQKNAKDTSEKTIEYLNEEADYIDVMEYILVVNDVQLSDVGTYLCQLRSDYGIEESRDIHIAFEGKKSIGTKKSWFNIYVVFMVGVCALLGIWCKCRNMRKGEKSGIYYSKDTSLSLPSYGGIMRRKHA